jgi:glycosyltransferase involved in cell wall biosynthesis
MKPLLSIVMAIKDSDAALVESLDALSMMDAISGDFEVLLINGGMPLGEFTRKNHPFPLTITNEPDQGIYDAWNKGIAIAKGEFIAFIGAGDCVRPNYLHEMKALLRQTPNAELLLCRQQQFLSNGRPLRIFGKPLNWREFQQNFSIPHIGCWHKTDLFEKYDNFDITYKVSGDYEWLLRVGERLKAVYTAEVLMDVPVGGVSDKKGHVFHESRRARATHTNASKLNLLYVDYAYRVRKTLRQWIWG